MSDQLPQIAAIHAAHVASELKGIDTTERLILQAVVRSDIDPMHLQSTLRRSGVTDDELMEALRWMKGSALIMEIPATAHFHHNSLRVNPDYKTAITLALHEASQ